MNWDEYFCEMALFVSRKSKDRSTKLGCVIADEDNNVLATGYNSFPRGLNDDLEERHMRPEKYLWTEHSERNAIYCAARTGARLKGAKMYLTPGPGICTGCARAIIQAGITEVILPGIEASENQAKWSGEAERSVVMFQEAGVTVRGITPS